MFGKGGEKVVENHLKLKKALFFIYFKISHVRDSHEITIFSENEITIFFWERYRTCNPVFKIFTIISIYLGGRGRSREPTAEAETGEWGGTVFILSFGSMTIAPKDEMNVYYELLRYYSNSNRNFEPK